MPHWNLQKTLSSETFLLLHDFWFLCSHLHEPFTLAGDNPSLSQISCSPCLHSSVTELFTASELCVHFGTADYSDQIRSVAQSCPTLCDPMNRNTSGLPVHHELPEFTQTHVHRVSDAIQPSHPLSSPSSPAPSPSRIRVFSNESTLRMRWPKYWSFSFSIIPSKEIPGLISFRKRAERTSGMLWYKAIVFSNRELKSREVKWGKKCLGAKAGGQQTAYSLLILCSCQGIKHQVPRALGCPPVPQAPGDGRRLRGDPKNSCIFSVSYIKVKHKISFERKGFTVNKQTSGKPPHGRANFKWMES